MAGRRPKPTNLRLVTGNAGKRPINTNEPQPREGFPDIPKHLNKKTRDTFVWVCGLLDDMGLLTVVDGIAIECLAKCYIEIMECDKNIEKYGYVREVVSTTGELVLKANPAVSQRADADRRLRAWLVEYGLTSASKTKVKSRVKEEKEDELAQFFG